MSRTKRQKTTAAVIAIVGVVIAAVLLVAIKYFQISSAIAEGKSHKPLPDAVTAMTATESIWPRTLSSVGTLAATQGVVLSAEDSGKVLAVNFESGSKIEKGQVLVELDSTVETATLEGTRAQAEQAKINLNRAKMLREKNANSQADLDSAVSVQRTALAAVSSLEATIAHKKVIAPFSGRAGIRVVNVGQYLSAGTPVVPLYAIDSLYVNFSLPQQTIAKLAVGNDVVVRVDAFEGEEFKAKVTAINPQVDSATRNVDVQATLANPGERLRPGMFIKAELVLPDTDKLIAIPASSITYAPYGNSVFVVDTLKDPEGKDYTGIRLTPVTLGATRGDQVAILTGLKAGEQVVTSGGFKLRPNEAVSVNNIVAPSNELAPKPSDT